MDQDLNLGPFTYHANILTILLNIQSVKKANRMLLDDETLTNLGVEIFQPMVHPILQTL